MGTCNDKHASYDDPVAVGSMTGCQSSVSSYEGVYDLIGNVSEWEDCCDGTYGKDTCQVRGGDFVDADEDFHCSSHPVFLSFTRDVAFARYIGFRCCS